MTTRVWKIAPLVFVLAAIGPTAAAAAIQDPQSDAAMRKSVRDYVRYQARQGNVVKAHDVKIDCVQAAKVGSTRPCSGTFALTLAGKTARYRLNPSAGTFRISPGAMEAHLNATATTRAAGLPRSIHWGGILQ